MILRSVEPQRRDLDGLNRQIFEPQFAMARDPFEPRADDMIGVFGEIDEHVPAATDLEAIAARRVARHRDGEVETEPALTALSRVPIYAARYDS